ncbi:MarR family transcriptional regulator [Nocardioides agariphilus]|jgi:DNA-binding MarR family transcriptional regulator|uniref:MarR family transcriptional regulator n=1 Tax=Nocardioides agariphilus TaxID=433664 RepID=A0A930VMN5_9ACTN|nr:MarR family transcriptional regulator [Nocardioides agariphilus]MBF4770329.1 MarR family transcriptional regulator [Nocardioides agariphilus]
MEAGKRSSTGDRSAARDLNSGAIHLLRAMAKVDAEAGLTRARLSALSVLVFGGPVPLGRLARIEGVTSPTMTRLVDGLVHAGLAYRQAHPDSDRMVLVSATEEGRALMLDAAERRADVLVASMGELSVAERRVLREAAPLLKRLAAGVVSQQAPSASRPAGPR